MAHETPATHDPAADHATGVDHAAHPTWDTYWKVAVILTLITAVEVWVYYVPAITQSRIFVPMLLFMSAVKFVIVVMFYMHLKYDNRLFRALFTGPLIIAATTIVALMFLFGQLKIKVGR